MYSPRELSKISLENLERFLQQNGWVIKKHPNEKAKLFSGPESDSGEKLEIFVPTKNTYVDYNQSINNILKILSNIYNITIESLIENIFYISSDLFKMRILNLDGFYNSIPLSLAAEEVKALKNLFIFGASSEQRSIPHFDKPTARGISHAGLCQFGHTFEGSFGFTINSPLSADINQLTLFKDAHLQPFERRVMERIVRGLKNVDEAVKRDDPNIIIENFDTGFNSRMCEAVLDMGFKFSKEICFNIEWSNQLNASEDVKEVKEIKIDIEGLKIVDYAKDELKKIEPFEQTILGKIINLHSIKEPFSDEDFKRTAIIKHEHDGKKIDVKLDLDKESYLKVYEAHGKGAMVSVAGLLYRKGNTWKMVDIKAEKITVLDITA